MAVVLLVLEPFYLKLSLRETPKTQCTYARVAKIKSFSTASPNVYVIYVVCFVYICLVWSTTCTFHVYVVYVVYKCLCLCCRCAKPDIEANCSCGVYVLDKDQNRLKCDCSLVPAKPGTRLFHVYSKLRSLTSSFKKKKILSKFSGTLLVADARLCTL